MDLVSHTDHDSKGGEIMLCVREDIAPTFLSSGKKPIESLYVELNLKNFKILINRSYNCHKAEIGNH